MTDRALTNRRYRARLRGEDCPLLLQRWTPQEVDLLVHSYSVNAHSGKNGWMRQLAKTLGRNAANVCRKARQLDLPVDRLRHQPEQKSLPLPLMPYTNSPKHRARSSRAVKAYIKAHGHPRGMLGKHHSGETCAQMSASHMGIKPPPFTDQHREKLSVAMSHRLRTHPNSVYSRTAKGRRKDLGGQFFRSAWEANYARFLNFIGEPWHYEAKTFWFESIKRGTRHYTPDFWLPKRNEYHEVKGWMDQKSATKLKRMAKYHPTVKIVLIDKAWFADAKRKGLKSLVPGWE